jgi:hypothetical protein
MLHLNFVVLDDYGKKMETVMINNSTNINKIDLTFSHLRSLNTKKRQHILIETQVLALLGLNWSTPLSTIFQLCRVGQFYWRRKLEYPEKTIDLPQVTNKSHIVVSSTPRLSGIQTHNVGGELVNEIPTYPFL